MKYALTILSIFLFTYAYSYYPEHAICFPNSNGDGGLGKIVIYQNDNVVLVTDINGNEMVYTPIPYLGGIGFYVVPIGTYTVYFNNGAAPENIEINEPFKLTDVYPAFDCNSNTSIIEVYNNGYTLTITDINGNIVPSENYEYFHMMDGVYRIIIEPGIYTISGYRQSCTQQPMPFTVNTIYPNSASVKLLSNGEDNTSLNIMSGTTVNFEGVITDYYGSIVSVPNDSVSFYWETTGGIETPSDLEFSHTFLDIGTYTVSLTIDDGVCVKTDNLTVIVGGVISVNEVDNGFTLLQAGNQIKVISDGEFHYTLYSIDGRVIVLGKSFGNAFIDTTLLSVGTYIMSITSGNTTSTRKFHIR